MISRIAITLLLAAAACTPATKVTGTDAGGLVEFGVTSEAVPAANSHCAKYGKTAKPTQVDAFGYMTFSCEPRS